MDSIPAQSHTAKQDLRSANGPRRAIAWLNAVEKGLSKVECENIQAQRFYGIIAVSGGSGRGER
jgi:hypothetical protein